MGIIRDSFVIFKNWAEAINTLPEEYQLETYKALVEYGMSGSIPEDISLVARAMLVSFSVGMENSICKYNASVENGKKGGNPNFKRGTPNPYYIKNEQEKDNPKITEDNHITQDNLDITQDNQTLPTHNLNVNVNDNVNVNVNDISQSNKEENNVFSSSYTHTHTHEGERVSYKTKEEREEYLVLFKDAFDTLTGSFKDAGLEIIDTLLEAREIACTFEGLKFNHKSIGKISFDEMVKHLESEKFREIAGQLALNAEIKNRPYYILGCLVNAYDEYLNKRRRKPYEIIE